MAIYFPVLRWKQGERAALGKSSSGGKRQNCSYHWNFHEVVVIQIVNIQIFCRNAVNDWGIARPFYLGFICD